MSPDFPEDFEAFWRETAEEALNFSLDYKRLQGDAFNLPGFLVEVFSFQGINGQEKHGWIAIPNSQSDITNHQSPIPNPKSLSSVSNLKSLSSVSNLKSKIQNPKSPGPAFLWVPPYGRESLLPDAYSTREGFVSMSFNFFGHGAFHQEKYIPSRGYFSEGVLDPKTWVFRSMFQDAVIALRILAEQPEVDANRLAVLGMSQGAGMSIWLGSWIESICAVCADMPFLGGMSLALGQHIYRYPLKELIDFAAGNPKTLERVKRTISYFDTLNLAAHCVKPTHISLGEKDPAVKPASVEGIFNALPGRKVLRRYPVGHDWFPAMIENNREWLTENV